MRGPAVGLGDRQALRPAAPHSLGQRQRSYPKARKRHKREPGRRPGLALGIFAVLLAVQIHPWWRAMPEGFTVCREAEGYRLLRRNGP